MHDSFNTLEALDKVSKSPLPSREGESDSRRFAGSQRVPFFITFILLFYLSLCLPCGLQKASAAEIRTLTLNQALTIAMEKNRDIEKAREYAKYVQGKYVEERAAALPQLSLNGSASLARDESQKALMGAAPRQFSRSADLTVSQPLYTWGKIGAALRAAELGLKTSEQQLRIYKQAAHRDVSAAFYDVLLAKELHKLALENHSQKKRHLDEAKRKLGAGVATDYDLLAAEVATENARPEVIRSENGVRNARDRLRFLLAISDGEIDVTGSLATPPGEDASPLKHGDARPAAGSRRPELADMRLRVGIYEELVKIADADDKPRLDLRGGAGWRWSGIDASGPSREADGAAWNVGVYLSFPFFDGLRSRGRVAQARSELKTREVEEAKLRDAVALEVRQAGFSLQEAAEIFRAVSGTVRLAERLVELAEKGYEFGVKIRLEVEDAQLNLLQAKSDLARAQRDYGVALVNYRWASGSVGE